MHFVNGKKVSNISITDRGLLYGQSVFETIAVTEQQPLLLEQHIARLKLGCQALSIPIDTNQIIEDILGVCDSLNTEAKVLRLMITMGEGGRGYGNPVSPSSNSIISICDYPDHSKSNWIEGIEIGVSDVRLSSQPLLAGIKHSNRLEQVLAKSNWQPNWQEAIMLDHSDNVIEATQSNIFLRVDDQLHTPDLSQSGVAGVMRDQVLKHAIKIGVDTKIVSLSLTDIESAQEVFLSNSLIGLWPVKQLKSQSYSDFNLCHALLKILRENGAIPIN